MWHYDPEVESIPVFPPTTSSHSHHPSQSYARASMSGSGSCGRSLEILHDPDDCTHCHAYKIHVIYASLQNDPAFERDWTGTIPGGRSSPDRDISPELSQTRTNLRRVRRERDDAIALNTCYQNEVALLERQLQEAKDRILAIEMAYGGETQLLNTDFLGEEDRGDGLLHEEAERDDDDFENILSSSSSIDSLDADLLADEFWTVEDPVVQTANFPNSSWNDSTDDFDLFQQLHLMIQEDETPREDDALSDALKKLPQTTINNSTLPVYCTDSSSNSPSPSTSSSLFSTSDWASNQSDDSSSPQLRLTSSDEELYHTLKLMASAHEEGNTTALTEIKKLIVQAERTSRHSRTKAQKYILLNWRSPSSSGRNNLPNSTSIYPQQPAPPVYPPPKGPEIFVDASPLGIGFVFKTQWLAWTFKNGPNIPLGKDGRIVMSWAELLAVEVGLRALITAGYRSTTITVRSDNTGVIEALEKKSWCQRHGIEEILQSILNLCGEYGIQLKPSWVSTKMNPADLPSRGVFPPSTLAFKFPPKLPARMLDLLELAAPAVGLIS